MNTQTSMKRFGAVAALAGMAMITWATQAPKTVPLSVTVTANKRSFLRGELITFTVRLMNKTKSPVKLDFPNGQRFDLYAVRANSGPKAKPIWKWSAGRAFNMMYSTVQLEPGKSQEFTGTWDQKVAPERTLAVGTYDIYATIASEQLKGISPAKTQIRILKGNGAVIGKMGIRGRVTRIIPRESTAPADNLLRLFVEGRKDSDTSLDKAYVTIRTGTKILVERRGRQVNGTVADIKKGSLLEIIFDGPILLSYPAQAGAATVIVKR